MLPGIAGAVSAALYLDQHRLFLNGTGSRSWVAGAAVAGVTWLASGLFLRRYAYPDRAIPTVYDELCTEYDELRVRYESLGEPEKRTAAGAATHLANVSAELGLGGPDVRPAAGLRWTLATGYVAAWKRLHRAREELLVVSPVHEVVEVAMEDRTRLQGSKIANADGFVSELELAIQRLDPGMTAYLDADRPSRPSAEASVQAAVPDVPYSADEEAHARLIVRRIARAIHEYRDSRRGGLVR